MATPERALADSLGHPMWGVTLAQIVEALDEMLSREPLFAERLATEVAQRHSHALARRFGFLVERLSGVGAARVFIPLRGSSKASTLMEAGGRIEGLIDPVWRVRVNVEIERLLQLGGHRRHSHQPAQAQTRRR